MKTVRSQVHKIFEILHSHGLVHRTHGGALPSREGALEDPTLREKRSYIARRSWPSPGPQRTW